MTKDKCSFTKKFYFCALNKLFFGGIIESVNL